MVGFSESVMGEIQALFGRYPKKVHALLPILHLAQRENQGWLPPGWDKYVADLCETTVNHVRGVMTFYNMFHSRPVGRFHLMVCTCLPCGLCRGTEILEHLERRLNIPPGQTTPDGLFSLEECQCLAACDKAPVMMVNGELHESVTTERIDQWLVRARALPAEAPEQAPVRARASKGRE